MTTEVTDNILYMKLLHELKAAFPAVSDDSVRQCISQYGKDKSRCIEYLSHETDRIQHGHYGRYNQQRKFSLQGTGYIRHNFNTGCSSIVTSESASTFQSYDRSNSEPQRRSLTLPFHLNLPPRRGQIFTKRPASQYSESSSHCDEISKTFNNDDTKSLYHDDLKSFFNEHNDDSKTFFSTDSKTSGYATSFTSRSNDSIPMVVLTPDSPPLGDRTLYHPRDDFNDIIMFGHANSLTATCLDIDLSSRNEEDEENDDICSLRTTTVSQGVINLMSRVSPLSTTDFTTIQQDTISLVSSRSSVSSSSCSSTSSASSKGPKKCRRTTKTTIYSTRKNAGSLNCDQPTAVAVLNSCNENPFRKVFVRRKQFYQNIEREGNNSGDENSSSKLIWRRRLCSLCSSSPNHRQCSGLEEKTDKNANRLTLNANIQPFAPFVIQHDMNSETGGTLMLCQPETGEANNNFYGEPNNNNINNIKNNSLLLRPCPGGLELSPDGREVRYATSTINSEDGVESHLEVSMNKDGSIITTRHKRLGTPTEVSNNSVLHVKYGEGGKVLNISQSQHLSPSPRATQKSPQVITRSPLLPSRQRPNSAYCTAQFPFSAPCSHLGSLRYNSLPNLNGRVRGPLIYEADLAGSSPWLYNTHPADEEKRMAYTRALLNHQMEQCMKLERELSMARHEVQEVKGDVIELEKKLNMNQLLTQGKISAEVIEQEITDLRQACDSMAEEVTKLTKGTVPLGETSIEFYESLPAALEEHEGSCPRFDVQRGGSRNDLGRRSNPNLVEASQGLVEEKQWSCSACTFLNHPALKNCEECDMPRIILGTTPDPKQQQVTKDCFCHTRSSVTALSERISVTALGETKSRRNKTDIKTASFDELSPVRELSPSNTVSDELASTNQD